VHNLLHTYWSEKYVDQKLWMKMKETLCFQYALSVSKVFYSLMVNQLITEETLALFGCCLSAPAPFHPMFRATYKKASDVIIHEI
jgi:hypothetical protein